MSTTRQIVGRVARTLREALLTVAALGGVICIVLTILAFTGGYSLIMFKTGSMAPTIPSGSVALVQKVPASTIAVGDVATVDRAGELPITHRITSVSPGPAAEQRVITMKGDANESADPAPYRVSQVRIVRGSVPGLAYVIVWFGNPWVLGAITVGAALLVTWAFWPRASRRETTDADDDSTTPDEADEPEPEFATRRERRSSRNAAAALGICLLVALPTFGSVPPAEAAGLISITSNGGGTHALDATVPYNWDVEIDASTAPADGDLTITLRGEGSGMHINTAVQSCTVRWDASGCPGVETTLDAGGALSLNTSRRRLLQRATPTIVHLRIAVTGSGSAAGSATLILRATAEQTSAEQSVGTTTLPATGGTFAALLAAPAAVLVGLGAALVMRARRNAAPR